MTKSELWLVDHEASPGRKAGGDFKEISGLQALKKTGVNDL